MGTISAVLVVVGIGVVYSALLKLVSAPENPVRPALRHRAINRTVRRELINLDRRYEQLCGC